MTNQLWDRELAKVFFDVFAENTDTNPAKKFLPSPPANSPEHLLVPLDADKNGVRGTILRASSSSR
jgi:hypothetical protein